MHHIMFVIRWFSPVLESEIERKKSWMRDDERFDLSPIIFDYAKK